MSKRKQLANSLLPATFICFSLMLYDSIKQTPFFEMGSVPPQSMFVALFCLLIIIELVVIVKSE